MVPKLISAISQVPWRSSNPYVSRMLGNSWLIAKKS